MNRRAAAAAAGLAFWDQPGWKDETSAWLNTDLTAPEIRIKNAHPWSVVARVQSADGVHWFKQVATRVGHEPALTETLARLVPRFLPEVVATDETRLLTRNAGRRLDSLVDKQGVVPLWEHVAARYAELLIELIPFAADIPAPDLRPAAMVALFGVRADPVVSALGDAIPPTLVHLDVGARNVCMRHGEPILIDWMSGAFTHPFCGLTRPLRDLMRRHGAAPDGAELRRVRDAFLEPWTAYAPPRELRTMFRAAYRLGCLCRAAIKKHELGAVPAAQRPEWEHKVTRELENFDSFVETSTLAAAR